MRIVFEKCASFSNHKSVYQAWADAYGVSSPDGGQPQLVATEIARRLSMLNGQLDLLEQKLKEQHPALSSKTTSDQIFRLRLFVANALTNMQAPWKDTKGQLTPDLMKCLEFWDEMLVADEHELPQEHLRELQDALSAAKESINRSENPELRRVLLELIALMERSLLDYSIGGEAAMHRSVREAISVFLANAELLRRNSETDAVSALAGAWKKFQDVCAPIIFADRFLNVVDRGKAIGSQIMKTLGYDG